MGKESLIIVDARRKKGEEIEKYLKGYLNEEELERFQVLKVETLKDLSEIIRTPGTCQELAAVVHLGGDGSLGFILNCINSLSKPPVPIISLGGGTANTTLKGLRDSDSIENPPENLIKLVKGKAKYVEYYPLIIGLDNNQRELLAAYLAGFGHLSIGVTQIFEGIRGKINNPTFGYLTSALISLANFSKRVRPSLVSESDNFNDRFLPALEVLAIPYLATFFLNQPNPPNEQVYVLSLQGNSETDCFFRYLATLVFGGLFPNGISFLIKNGIARINSYNKISLLPDQKENPNACLDGELTFLEGQVSVSRSKKPVEILFF